MSQSSHTVVLFQRFELLFWRILYFCTIQTLSIGVLFEQELRPQYAAVFCPATMYRIPSELPSQGVFGNCRPNLPAAMSASADANTPPATVHVCITAPTTSAASEKSATLSAPPKESAPPSIGIGIGLRLPAISPLATPHSGNQRDYFPFSSAPTPGSTATPAATSTKKRVLTETPPSTEHPLLNKFILYESKTKFYAVASNTNDSRHRMLKIDRTHQDQLDIEHNDITYTGRQMNGVIKMLEDGNKHTGGLGRPRVFFGIAGTRYYPFTCANYESIYLMWCGQASSSLPQGGTWS